MGNHLLQKISSPCSSHRAHPGSAALTRILHAVASLQGSLEKDGNDSVPVKDGRSCPFHMPFKCEDSTQAKQHSIERIRKVPTAYHWKEV